MKNIYDYFLLALPEKSKLIIESFEKDCKKIKSNSDYENLINKYNLIDSSFVDMKTLDLKFNNINCNLAVVHVVDEFEYYKAKINFSLDKKIDNNKKIEFFFHNEIKDNENYYKVDISIYDNYENKVFNTQFGEHVSIFSENFNNKISMYESLNDQSKEKNNINENIGKNKIVMIEILKNFQNTENLFDSTLLLTDIEVESNYFIQELCKLSLMIKNNLK